MLCRNVYNLTLLLSNVIYCEAEETAEKKLKIKKKKNQNQKKIYSNGLGNCHLSSLKGSIWLRKMEIWLQTLQFRRDS